MELMGCLISDEWGSKRTGECLHLRSCCFPVGVGGKAQHCRGRAEQKQGYMLWSFVDGDDCFFLQAAFSLGAGEFLFMSSFPRFYHCSVVGRIVQGNKLDIPTQLLYLLKYSIILMFFCDFQTLSISQHAQRFLILTVVLLLITLLLQL